MKPCQAAVPKLFTKYSTTELAAAYQMEEQFFWEQTTFQGCLTIRLSGNRQKWLAAPIPVPGGDQ